MIETSQLQTLVAVAKSKSFSRAAEFLNVTQSAISQSIKNLEKKVEVKLFKRSGKKVVLTFEGEKIFQLAEDFLSKMELTLTDVKQNKNTMTGRVRIGTLTGFGKSWLAPTMLKYAEDYPDLTISVNLAMQDALVRDFENYQLDFLILPEESLPGVGEKKLIGEEYSMLVYPTDKKFDLHQDMTMDEISAYPTILFQEKGDGLYLKWCRQKFGSSPKKINPRYIINSHGNMLQAVHKGLGLAVIPRHVLMRSYYKDKVNIFDTDEGVFNAKFYVVYHKGSDELLRMKKTLELLTSNNNPLLCSK